MSHEIKHIVCAVRSRPGGERTVRRAIDLALETGASLTFFQTVDAEFVRNVIDKRASLKAIYQELEGMAEFTMTILCNQARLRGVKKVDCVVRRGDVRQQLIELVAELDPDILVMGRPYPSPGPDRFLAEELDHFVAELEEKGQLQVVTPE
jgi:nucleotide-binding universal stress UspA family protein